MTTACAPGKVILFGEHAVVYGRPAIAVPVTQVQARAVVEDAPVGQGIVIHAADLHLQWRVGAASPADDTLQPMEATVRHTLERLSVQASLDIKLTVSSTVPIARGLGSGAAVSAAIVRALAAHFGQTITPQEVSDLVYQSERIYHGTPSGIDNTVVAFEQPIYFVKGHAVQVLSVGRPLWLVIGDTGIASPTRDVVADVRQSWQREPRRYETLFDRIAAVVARAREAVAFGDAALLGHLMDENQELLEAIGVSSPELERLVSAARQAGAMGAKLCGAGRGGNMIALVAPEETARVAAALREAGAVNTIISEVVQTRPA